MVALQEGDRASLRPVFDALAGPVHRFARSLLPGPAAEDAAQMALVRIFERTHEYDRDRGRVLAWALTVTAWQCRTVARRAQREQARAAGAPDDEAVACEQPGPLVALLDRERRDKALAAIDGLSAADRDALRRTLEDGALTGAERKRKQRALRRLRGALGLLLWKGV